MEWVIGAYKPPDWRAELTTHLLAYVLSHGTPWHPSTGSGPDKAGTGLLDHQCILVVEHGAVLRDETWEPVPGLVEHVLVLTEVACACGRFHSLELAAPGTVGEVLGYLGRTQPPGPG